MIRHRRGIRGLGRAAMRLEAGGRPKQRGRLVLRDARTPRPCCRTRAPCALLRTRAVQHTAPAALCRWPQSHLTMSNSVRFFVPAAHFCARVVASGSHPTRTEGRAKRREARYFICRAGKARRHACRIRRADALPPRRLPPSVPPANAPGPPRGAVTSRGPRDATSPRLRRQDRLRRTPLDERDAESL